MRVTRPFLIFPDKRLQTVCTPVETVDDTVRGIWDEMLTAMYGMPGVGLAAPQVGVLRRVIVVDVAEKHITLINPEISAAEGEQVGLEGCLSIPDLVGEVTRAEWVLVKGLSSDRRVIVLEGEGLLARALQHEVDHLDGILFPARVEDITRLWSASDLSAAAASEVTNI